MYPWFDEFGSANCSGTPKTCTPLWTGATSSTVALLAGCSERRRLRRVFRRQVVHVRCQWGTRDVRGRRRRAPLCGREPRPVRCRDRRPWPTASCMFHVNDGKLLHVRRQGYRELLGTPKTCRATWTASGFGGETGRAAPAVANGIVYSAGNRRAMRRHMTATGTTAVPALPRRLAAVDGNGRYSRRYFARGSERHRFMSVRSRRRAHSSRRRSTARSGPSTTAGITNCSGTPKTCTPLWQGGHARWRRVFARDRQGHRLHRLVRSPQIRWARYGRSPRPPTETASGTPKTCPPLWTATTAGAIDLSSPAIENGVLFVGSPTTISTRSTPGHHELLGNAEDVHPAMDRGDRRRGAVVASACRQQRVRRFRRLQALRLRSPIDHRHERESRHNYRSASWGMLWARRVTSPREATHDHGPH